eukprot:SAG31_NODE_33319_length_345_cov_0.833333_1_plen_71_part_01
MPKVCEDLLVLDTSDTLSLFAGDRRLCSVLYSAELATAAAHAADERAAFNGSMIQERTGMTVGVPSSTPTT